MSETEYTKDESDFLTKSFFNALKIDFNLFHSFQDSIVGEKNEAFFISKDQNPFDRISFEFDKDDYLIIKIENDFFSNDDSCSIEDFYDQFQKSILFIKDKYKNFKIKKETTENILENLDLNAHYDYNKLSFLNSFKLENNYKYSYSFSTSIEFEKDELLSLQYISTNAFFIREFNKEISRLDYQLLKRIDLEAVIFELYSNEVNELKQKIFFDGNELSESSRELLQLEYTI